jgi:hypothetical protein
MPQTHEEKYHEPAKLVEEELQAWLDSVRILELQLGEVGDELQLNEIQAWLEYTAPELPLDELPLGELPLDELPLDELPQFGDNENGAEDQFNILLSPEDEVHNPIVEIPAMPQLKRS